MSDQELSQRDIMDFLQRRLASSLGLTNRMIMTPLLAESRRADHFHRLGPGCRRLIDGLQSTSHHLPTRYRLGQRLLIYCSFLIFFNQAHIIVIDDGIPSGQSLHRQLLERTMHEIGPLGLTLPEDLAHIRD